MRPSSGNVLTVENFVVVKDISKLAAPRIQIALENDVSATPAEPKPSFKGM